MIPSYRWICPVCDAPNPPAETCNHCGAPVRLSESEIALARTRGVAALDARRQDAHRARANWMARPLWRRVGDVICGTLFLSICSSSASPGFSRSSSIHFRRVWRARVAGLMDRDDTTPRRIRVTVERPLLTDTSLFQSVSHRNPLETLSSDRSRRPTRETILPPSSPNRRSGACSAGRGRIPDCRLAKDRSRRPTAAIRD